MSPEHPAAEPVAAWTLLLDTFEEEIRRVNRGESTEAAVWTAPEDFPPLPADLAGRALSILERQRATAERASAARREIGRELAAVRAIPAATGTQLPRYIDRLA